MTADATAKSRAPAPPQHPRYSLVVPVYNEAENIGSFCKALAELPAGHEVLICHDFEGDDTLAALDRLPREEKPASLRFVLNTLGPGVRYAIEAGMREAAAPVVVVTMADISDDFSRVEAMVSGVEAGADVVCASRYMPGGRQIGGPMIKAMLSRLAGLTLHRLSGLPTRDPTNSFKAYSREFLRRTRIESPAGFALAMELTVKAHFGGGRVEEVPATWRGRTKGTSRFRLFSWLPLYLRWYFWALRRRWLRPGPEGRFFPGSLVPRLLTVLVLAASALGLLSVPISIYDDSLLLLGARLVAGGKVPYIDFYTHYGPLGYTILAFLVRLFGNPGMALRMGEILLLAGIAILWHVLFHSLQPESPLREYAVPFLVGAVSGVALQPAFFGFAFATGALALFLLARNAPEGLPATLLYAAAGVALAVGVLIRPVFGAYCAGALLLLETAGRPRFGGSRNPLAALAVFFGTAACSAPVLWSSLYSGISGSMAFNATILMPARLVGAGGTRYLDPDFLLGAGTSSLGLTRAIATGAALVATTIAWTIAVSRTRTRRLAATCVAAGGLLPLLLTVSEHPARDAGFLSLAFFVLVFVLVFSARRALQESALLRASATFGLVAAAFGHYFWARADRSHLLPMLTLALAGAALLLASLRSAGRAAVLGLMIFTCVSAVPSLFFPAALLLKRGVVVNLRPWRCTLVRADVVRAVAYADSQADPKSRFVAVGSSQAWSSADPILLFLISSRLPYTRWFQYDPGVQTSAAVENEMARELEASGSRTAVVWRADKYLVDWIGPNLKARSAFDDFFDKVYPITAAKFGDYEVRVRAPGAPAAHVTND